jgi:putative protein-disulfide isomerase
MVITLPIGTKSEPGNYRGCHLLNPSGRSSSGHLNFEEDYAMQAILTYFYDPLCGWCYGAEPLLEALESARPDLTIDMRGGGLFGGGTLAAAKRQMIRGADARIGTLTGQVFGTPYLDGLLADPATQYDSVPPIAAILAVQAMQPGAGLLMLRAIQHAHYREGRRVVEPAVLAQIAESVGCDPAGFAQAYEAAITHGVQAHIIQTRQGMQTAGLGGFPVLLLQAGDRTQVLRHDQFYGHAPAFVAHVAHMARQLAGA